MPKIAIPDPVRQFLRRKKRPATFATPKRRPLPMPKPSGGGGGGGFGGGGGGHSGH
jgi:hypothetical protein